MISIDELPEVKGGVQVAGGVVVVEQLSDEENDLVGYLDSQIEGQATRTRPGDLFSVNLALGRVSLKIVSALKQLWESGGWVVGVIRSEETAQVVFARPKTGVIFPKVIREAMEKRDAEIAGETAPIHVSHEGLQREPKMTSPLLVRMPTRGRPEQALQVIAAYRQMARGPVQIEVVIDEDDASMVDTRVLQRLVNLDCVVTVGSHRNKIHAVNSGRVDDWAILALASDDMVPVVDGYDERIIAAMDRHFPLRDGAVYFDDGYNKSHAQPDKPVLCTMPVMGRHLWEDFGYVYHPGYGSLYSDNEQTEILTAMRRIEFVDEHIVEHRHHAAGKTAFDAVYKHNDDKWGAADKALFEKRANLRQPCSQFAFGAPPLTLSILVCSTTERAHLLHRLERHLRAQMRRWPRRVELVVDVDDGQKSIGQKRNDLLARAVGQYVAFVDDDDMVAHDYVDRIVDALTLTDGEADCASLEGVITTNGENPERFTHSIEHARWYSAGGTHYRTPNHLNPIKRELALQAGFPEKNFAEDHDFSQRVLPLLKSEVSTGAQPLYYYWFRSKK